MKIKLDQNLTVRLLAVLRRHGHDADTVRDEGLTGWSNHDRVGHAGAGNRCLARADIPTVLAAKP